MRIIVMFDLPVGTAEERRSYQQFRKYLLKSGFLMLQESIYCKLAPNSTMADFIVDNVKKHKPDKGIVQLLRITEKQYSKMEYITGTFKSDVLDTDERFIIL